MGTLQCQHGMEAETVKIVGEARTDRCFETATIAVPLLSPLCCRINAKHTRASSSLGCCNTVVAGCARWVFELVSMVWVL